jgi:hypothetical protein
MSNLIKQNNISLPNKVSNQSKLIFQANSQIMIREMDDINIVVNSIHQAISKTVFEKGINIDVEELNKLKLIIQDDIIKDFNMLSLQDIHLCFKMGVRGDLGEYFGLNVVSFYGWLKKYKNEFLPNALKEVSKYIEPVKLEEPKVNLKDLDIHKVNNLYKAIIDFDENGIYDFNDYGNIHYNFLEKFGYFDYLTEEDKINYTQLSKELLVSEEKSKNLSLLSQGKNFHLSDINDLLKKIEIGEKNIEGIIEIYYKKLILKNFITNFKNNHQDLEYFKNTLLTKINDYYDK